MLSSFNHFIHGPEKILSSSSIRSTIIYLAYARNLHFFLLCPRNLIQLTSIFSVSWALYWMMTALADKCGRMFDTVNENRLRKPKHLFYLDSIHIFLCIPPVSICWYCESGGLQILLRWGKRKDLFLYLFTR